MLTFDLIIVIFHFSDYLKYISPKSVRVYTFIYEPEIRSNNNNKLPKDH